MVEFLYAVRQFPSTVCEFVRNKAEGPEYNIPSRYHGKANLFLKKDLINAAVDCFGGELPKILTGLFPNINNAFINSNNAFSLEHTYILRKLYIIYVSYLLLLLLGGARGALLYPEWNLYRQL